MVLAIDFHYYLAIGGLAPAINVFIAASAFTLFVNTFTIIFNKIYLKVDEARDMRYNYISNDNPYQLTSNQSFRNLCFNDVILHFINLIKIYDPKVLNLAKFQDGKENFQLVIDTVDYIIFELYKFDYFIKYQVLLNNVNITSDDDAAIMDKVFAGIPEWRFIIAFPIPKRIFNYLTCAISMCFSLLSIFIAVLYKISHQCQIIKHNNEMRFTHKLIISGVITISSKYAKRYHLYSRHIISRAIISVVDTCDDNKYWTNRYDISCNIEVYYIKDHIGTQHEFDVDFELTIESSYITNKINAKTRKNIQLLKIGGIDNSRSSNNSSKNGSSNNRRITSVNHKKFKGALMSTLKLPVIHNINVSDLSTRSVKRNINKVSLCFAKFMSFGSNETTGDNTFDGGLNGATTRGNASTIGTFAMVSPTSPTLPTLLYNACDMNHFETFGIRSMSSVSSRQALVGGGVNSPGSAAGAPIPASVLHYDTIYNYGIIDNEMDHSDPRTVEVESGCIIDNVAATGDGNCNCIDGVTMYKISVETSGTALAIMATINLIAVE